MVEKYATGVCASIYRSKNTGSSSGDRCGPIVTDGVRLQLLVSRESPADAGNKRGQRYSPAKGWLGPSTWQEYDGDNGS